MELSIVFGGRNREATATVNGSLVGPKELTCLRVSVVLFVGVSPAKVGLGRL